jgi:hypothetical protein
MQVEIAERRCGGRVLYRGHFEFNGRPCVSEVVAADTLEGRSYAERTASRRSAAFIKAESSNGQA